MRTDDNVCAAQHWVQAFLTNIFSTLVATTNGLERQHQKLKYSYLHDTSNGSLYDLLSVVIRTYVPSCQKRYSSASNAFIGYLIAAVE